MGETKRWSRLENFAFGCVVAGFFGGAASLAGMGIARVWEQEVTYRLAASAGIVCAMLFVVGFIIGLILANAEEAISQPTPTDSRRG